MIDINKIDIGDKVHYKPAHYSDDQWENGIVKDIREDNSDGVWVVYHCDGNWSRYEDYTGALTNLRDLNMGWRI